jgi:hypothetical protein
MERAGSVLAFVTLLLTCVGGIAHASWWTACAGASVLVLISVVTRQRIAVRSGTSDVGLSDQTLAAASLLNGSAAASAAFLFGKLTGWFWGF